MGILPEPHQLIVNVIGHPIGSGLRLELTRDDRQAGAADQNANALKACRIAQTVATATATAAPDSVPHATANKPTIEDR